MKIRSHGRRTKRQERVEAGEICGGYSDGNGHTAADSLARRRSRKARDYFSCILAECLEPRRMLTVNSAGWFDNLLQQGTTYSERQTNTDDSTFDINYNVIGPATFNGISCVEVDVTSPIGAGYNAVQKGYEGIDANGDFVTYGVVTTSTTPSTGETVTTEDDYMPYLVDAPMSLTAGVPQTFTDTDVNTVNSSSGVSTTTSSDSVQFILASETPTPITVPFGTIDSYQVNELDTTVGTTTTDTTTLWIAPGVGAVQQNNSDGSYVQLTNFNGVMDHLAFVPATQIPTTAAGATLPAVTVAVQNSGNEIDTNASGSVTLSLQSASRLNTSTGTLGGTVTQPIVDGVATFNDLSVSADGTYTLTASDTSNDTPITSGKFKIGSSTLQLAINSKAPGGAKGVKTGDVIFYSMLVTPKPGEALQSQVLVVTFPTGFMVTSDGGGTVSGNTITWTTGPARAFNFDLKVPSAQAMGGIKSVIVTGDDNVTYLDSTTDEGLGSNTVKLATSFEVDGTVHDVVSQVAALGNIITRSTLAGVLVQMIDSTGAVIDSQVTGGGGTFSLTAKAAGTYQLLFSAVAGMYSTASNTISNLRFYLSQSVTFEPSNTTPIDLGDLYMPKTFLSNSAKVLMNLNNYKTSDFGGLQSYTFPLFQFNTTGAEGVLTGLAGTQANPGSFMNAAALQPGQQTDPWVAAIRMMLGMAAVDRRFSDSFRLVDLTAKAASVALSVALVKSVQTGIRDYNAENPGVRQWNVNPLIQQSATDSSISQGLRVSLFTSLGQVVSSAFDTAVSVIPVSAAAKAQIATYKAGFISTVFTSLRFGYDLLTGQKIVADGLFESVFNLIRIGIDMILLQGLSGASLRSDIPSSLQILLGAPEIAGAVLQQGAPNLQDIINSLVNNRMGYDTNTDTNDVADSIEFFDDQAHQASSLAMGLVSSLNTFGSVTRGIDGAGFLLGKAKSALMPGSLASGIQAFAAAADKGAGLIIQGGSKALSEVSLPPLLATAGVGFLYQLYEGQLIANVVQTGSTGSSSLLTGSLPTSVSPVSAPAADSVAAPEAARSAAFQTAATASSPTDAAAFVSDLNQLTSLVKASNSTAIAAMYSQFVSDENALFSNDLVLLDNQADTLGPQLSQAQKNIVGGFDTALANALNQVTFASEQLDAWGSDPATGSISMVTSQFSATMAAVNSAVKQASAVRALVDGATIPVSFSIAETAVPATAAVGSTQTLTFTITNVGSSPSSAGTISFITTDGSMILSSAAQQALAPLAAGGSATYSWQVQIATPVDTAAGASFQVLAVAADVTANLTDSITVNT